MKENTKSITCLYELKGSSGASNECLHLIPEESFENLFPISLCQETQIEYQKNGQRAKTANYLKYVEVVYDAPKFDGSFKNNNSNDTVRTECIKKASLGRLFANMIRGLGILHAHSAHAGHSAHAVGHSTTAGRFFFGKVNECTLRSKNHGGY